MKASYLTEKFAAALDYTRYLETGTQEQRRRWQQFHDLVKLTEEQKRFLAGFTREMKVLVVSGIWCGDCVQQCPLLQHIAEANPAHILLRLVDRDQHADLSADCASTAATGCRSSCSCRKMTSCAASTATAL